MTEIFEKALEEVMTKFKEPWYDVVDSDRFELVVKKIAKEMKIHPFYVWENAEFKNWYTEMCADL